jgi:hypothetical protein
MNAIIGIEYHEETGNVLFLAPTANVACACHRDSKPENLIRDLKELVELENRALAK